jgi:snoRNA binding domain-containing protein (fibrillarin)
VPAAVLVRGGPTLYRVDLAPRKYTAFPVGDSLDEAAAEIGRGYPSGLPVALVRALREAAAGPISCSDPDLRRLLEAVGFAVRAPALEEERAAVAALPALHAVEERHFLLRLARERVQETLASDEEALIALAREEERVERSVNRELGAAEQFLAAASGPLAEYAQDWAAERILLSGHHDRLHERLETVAERTVPNLTLLLGARVAARLVALAGNRAALARVSASRLQVLGSRRRPGGGRGPRFGVLYRAARMSDVPRDRQGRYARSLAALASIAARADALTHRDLGELLVVRRDRRIAQLRRRP